MRLRVVTFPLFVILALAGPLSTGSHVRRAPKQANIVAACTAGEQAHISPATVAMQRADHVVWGSASKGATSWTITPKNPKDWPWAQKSFSGTPETPATTPPPLASAKAGHSYKYNVSVTCADGTSQTIDPDIIIETGD